MIRQAILNKKKWIKNKIFYDMDSKKPYSYRGFHLIRNSPELVPLINDELQLSKENSAPQNINALSDSNVNNHQDTYIVDIYPTRNKTEEFEKKNENFTHIIIKSIPDYLIYDKNFFHKIEIILTTEGMLDLGETFIRKAMLFKKNTIRQTKKLSNEIKNLILLTY